MWIYTTAAVTRCTTAPAIPTSAAYNEGANWVGVLFAAYNGFAALAAIVIPWMARAIGLRSATWSTCDAGRARLLSRSSSSATRQWLLLSMVGVGFAWASILSLPYALLSERLPAKKMGVYMGIFNFFIVIPQLVAASVLGVLLKTFFGNEPIWALVIGGVSLHRRRRCACCASFASRASRAPMAVLARLPAPLKCPSPSHSNRHCARARPHWSRSCRSVRLSSPLSLTLLAACSNRARA
jgi:hypothetical protein